MEFNLVGFSYWTSKTVSCLLLIKLRFLNQIYLNHFKEKTDNYKKAEDGRKEETDLQNE